MVVGFVLHTQFPASLGFSPMNNFQIINENSLPGIYETIYKACYLIYSLLKMLDFVQIRLNACDLNLVASIARFVYEFREYLHIYIYISMA